MHGLLFYSLKWTFEMHLSGNEEIVGQAFVDLLNVFNASFDVNRKTVKLDAMQQYTEDLQRRITSFVDMHKESVPSVNNLQVQFNKLKDGEYFFLLPLGTKFSNEEVIEVMNILSSLNGVPVSQDSMQNIKDNFRCIFDNYEMISATPPHKVGEPQKDKRVCRFCGKSMPETSFKQKGHAISEGLGNKTIVLNEECDTCNARFGSGIELSVISYFDPFRIFFGVKGKNSEPKLKGEGYFFGKAPLDNATTDSKVTSKPDLVITTTQSITNNDGTIPDVTFPSIHAIAPQDIYRAFCKYAISVLQKYDADTYKQTVDWINGNITLPHLPIVNIAINYNFFDKEPKLILYKRKSSNKNLPNLVGELHFTCHIIVFVVPLITGELVDFTDTKDWESFWGCFKHYSSITNWKSCDFSDNTRSKMNYRFKFKQGQSDQ